MTPAALPFLVSSIITLCMHAPPPKPKSARTAPPANCQMSHLLPLTRMSQKEVAGVLQCTPANVQAIEKRGLARIKAALLAEPEVIAESSPDLARRHGIVARRREARTKQVWSGRYLSTQQLADLEDMQRHLALWRAVAADENVDAEDRAVAQEAAQEIETELMSLERRLRAA